MKDTLLIICIVVIVILALIMIFDKDPDNTDVKQAKISLLEQRNDILGETIESWIEQTDSLTILAEGYKMQVLDQCAQIQKLNKQNNEDIIRLDHFTNDQHIQLFARHTNPN